MAIISLKILEAGDANVQVAIERIKVRALKRRLQRLHQDHDRQENLGGMSCMKTWGLASIPNDGLVAACVSIHPGDMPEYVIPSLEKSTLVFASDTSEDRLISFPWLDIPAVWDVVTTQRAVLDAILDYSNVTNSMASGFSHRIIAAASGALRYLAPEDDNEPITTDETCAICKASIPFESLTEACCNQGHQCSEFTFHSRTISSLDPHSVLFHYACTSNEARLSYHTVFTVMVFCRI